MQIFRLRKVKLKTAEIVKKFQNHKCVTHTEYVFQLKVVLLKKGKPILLCISYR